MIFGSLFSCGDGCGVGAKLAGFNLAWGLELRRDVAEVGNANLGNHIRVGNILDANPYDFDYVDVLHASPPCTRASKANPAQGETALDLALAQKVLDFVKALQPKVFTLENVAGYKNFDSWKRVLAPGLLRSDYFYDVAIVDAADFGVPQNRMRMIVRATKNLLSPLQPTHTGQSCWYEAIKDLAPTFDHASLTAREATRFHDSLEPYSNVAFDVQNVGRKNITIRPAGRPMYTLTSQNAGRHQVKCRIDGEYRRLSVRALARIQTFPDWYRLPDKKILASYVVGNAVPPVMYKAIIESVKGYIYE